MASQNHSTYSGKSRHLQGPHQELACLPRPHHNEAWAKGPLLSAFPRSQYSPIGCESVSPSSTAVEEDLGDIHLQSELVAGQGSLLFWH